MFDKILGLLMPSVGDILDRFVPNKEKAAEARREIEKIFAEAEAKGLLAQLGINKEEAKHRSIFVAGWRPFIGWTCGFALCWHFVAAPFAMFALAYSGVQTPPLPEFDMQSLLTILLGMLGLGGLRTYEKKKGLTK